jgi:hypothetical protein
MARNPFFIEDQAPDIQSPVERAIVVLRTFLGTRTVAELRAKLVRSGLPSGLANTVVRLDEIPDPVLNVLLSRIADPRVLAEVRRRLRL